jgi:acetylornithine deacetylase/succinyl-diaminopimelate desuccinylase-like protein
MRAELKVPHTAAFSAADSELLVHLLRLPTAGPLETGDADRPPVLWQAGRVYAQAAARLGFTTVHHGPADPAALGGDEVPLTVRRALARWPDFLACQPNLVLRLGPSRPVADTVMFNVHLDTVAGLEPVVVDGIRISGRGAVDAKGPAVALLAGVRAALAAVPDLADRISVLIQAVAGEEGGAMGVFGTRPLVAAGHVGRLNLFCEPTGRRLLTRCTAAMTASVCVQGDDAIDDRPGAGHNATVLLGYLAQHLASTLPGIVPDGRVCVAGLQTGPLHNRVYGTGRLLLNLAYGSADTARRLETALVHQLRAGLAMFTEQFRAVPGFERSARDAATVTRLEWLKHGLPVLDAMDPWAYDLLVRRAGLRPWPRDETPFTCDAIWAGGVPDTFTAVYGPGDLHDNRAHAAGEHVDLADLELFAADVGRILTCFSNARSESP